MDEAVPWLEPGAPPPSELVSCPPQIDALWRKATAPDPAQRHKTVREFLTELQEAAAAPKAPVLKTVGNPKAAAAPAKLATPSADDDSSATPKPQTVHSVGFNWKLLRNLVIIAGLLYAIKFAWEFKERKAANIEKQNKELLAKQEAEKQRAIDEARDRIIKSRTPQTGIVGPTDTEIVPPPPPLL